MKRPAFLDRAPFSIGSTCKCIDVGVTVGVDPRFCPEHAYDAGRRHERNVYLEERAVYLAEIFRLRAQVASLQESEAMAKHVPGEMCPTYLAAKGEWEAEIARLRAMGDAIVDALPKCDEHPDRPALRAWIRGGSRLCDECGKLPPSRAPDAKMKAKR